MSKTEMYVIRVSLHDQHFLKAERAGTDHVCPQPYMAQVANSLFFTTPVHMAELAAVYGVDAFKILEDCLSHIHSKELTEVYGYNEKCEFIDRPLRGPHCPYMELLSINPLVLSKEYNAAVRDLLDNRLFFVDETTGFPSLDLFGRISMAEYKKRKAEEALAKVQASAPEEKSDTQEPTQQKSNKVFLRYVMSCCGTEVRMEEFDVYTEHPSGPNRPSEYHFSVEGNTVYLYAVVVIDLFEFVSYDEFMEKRYNSRDWREKMIEGVRNTPIHNAFFGRVARVSSDESSDGSRNCFGDFIVEGKKNPEEPQEQADDLFLKIIGGIEETMKDVGVVINQVKRSSQLSQAKAMIKTLLQGIKKGDVDVVDVGVDVRGKKYALRMNDQLGASDWLTLHKAKIFMGGEVEVGRYIVPTAMMEQFKEAMGE